jgi:hypothetical protein
MYGFADAVEIPFFEEMGGFGIVLLILLAIVVIAGMMYVADKVMDKLAGMDGEVDESEEKWIDLCQETDNDVFCLAISFLVNLHIRYLIRGENKPYEPGHAGNVVQSDANILYLVSIVFAALVGAGTLAHQQIHKYYRAKHGHGAFRRDHPYVHRGMDVIQHCNFMGCAWCFLFWGEWQLYVLGWESTVIGGCLVVAVFLSLSSFGVVLALYKFIIPNLESGYGIKRALKSLELSLGILVGFSWERAFDVGFEEMELKFEHMHETAGYAGFLFYALNIFLFLVVAPAWFLYIFPKAQQVEEDEKKEEKQRKEESLEAEKMKNLIPGRS